MLYRIIDLWFLSAITPLHVGVGRSPGVVDLPIARDSFGYPWIPASGLKGAVKAACIMSSYNSKECFQYYGWDVDEYSGIEPWVSSILFTDAFLFAFPVRAIVDGEEKIIYIVPLSSINRLNDLKEDIVRCSCINEVVLDSLDNSGGSIRIKYFDVEYMGRIDLADNLRCIMDRMPSFIRHIIDEGVYVIKDSDARHIIETELLRVARIRLDPRKKTVRKGALWTEEYVPQATLFVSAVLYRKTKTDRGVIEPRCAKEFQKEVLEKINNTLFIGGKETIGKGLIKIIEA